MESATFQRWLAEQGCRFDTQQEQRGMGHGAVTVHRKERKTEIPLGGPRQAVDPGIIRRACDDLGLPWPYEE